MKKLILLSALCAYEGFAACGGGVVFVPITTLSVTTGTSAGYDSVARTVGFKCTDFPSAIGAWSITSIAGPGGATLSFDPASGTAAGGHLSAFVVTITTTGISPGTYSGGFTLHTASGDQAITILLTVVTNRPPKTTYDNFASQRTNHDGTVPLWSIFNCSCTSGSACASGPGGPLRQTFGPPQSDTGCSFVGSGQCDMQALSIAGGTNKLTNTLASALVDACPYWGAWTAGTTDGYNWPYGRVSYYLQSGDWDALFNRVQFTYTCNQTFGDPLTTDSNDSQYGTYIADYDITGSAATNFHFYHKAFALYYANQPVKFTQSATGAFSRGANPNTIWPSDPEWVAARGHQAHYYDMSPYWYYSPWRLYLTSSRVCTTGPVMMWKELHEPDEYVSNIQVQWSGTAYELSFQTSKGCPSCGWNDPIVYDIRYSTAGSMKTLGFSSGTALPTANSYNSVEDSLRVTTSGVSQVAQIWWAFRPTVVVQTATNTSPILVNTMKDMNLTTGDQVTISGVGGNTAANGTFTVTAIPRTWFNFFPNVDHPSIQLVSIVTNTANNPNTTFTTSVAHGFIPGQIIMTQEGNGPVLGYPRTFTIVSVPTSTTFTVEDTYGLTTGTITVADMNSLYMWSLPVISLNGSTGNGTYTSGGTIVATSNTSNFAEVGFPNDSPATSTGGTTMTGKARTTGKVVH